jgi:transposase
MGRPRLTEAEKRREKKISAKTARRSMIVTLHKSGHSNKEIHDENGIPYSTINGVLQRYSNGDFIDRPRKGRPKKLTERDMRDLARNFDKNDVKTRREAKKMFHEQGIEVSEGTIKTALEELGFEWEKKKRKPLLSEAHKTARFQFCKNYEHFTEKDWERVIFSDETYIEIDPASHSNYAWLRKRDRNTAKGIIYTTKYPKKICIWMGICAKGCSRPAFIKSTLNAEGYIAILERELQAFIKDYRLRRHLIFQQDNAPCHKAKICQNWFQNENMQVLNWPANSPDLNPIENGWTRLKDEVAKGPLITTKEELCERVEIAVKSTFTPEYCKTLIHSMTHRIQACIAANGGHTKY